MIKVKLTTKVDSDVLVVGLGSVKQKLQIESVRAATELTHADPAACVSSEPQDVDAAPPNRCRVHQLK